MGRKKSYTPARLRRGVEKYFQDITRTVTVREMVPTGELDKYGHPVLEPVDVVNDQGEAVRVREFVEPPTVGGLCRHLGISRSTWERYAEAEETRDIAAGARDVMQDYLERELLVRPGKQLRGVIFSLQAHYGQSEKHEIKVDGDGKSIRVVIGDQDALLD